MNAKVRALLSDALTLPREERLALAEHLFAATEIDEIDIAPEFLAELDARCRAYERGEDRGESAFEALDQMRQGKRDGEHVPQSDVERAPLAKRLRPDG